MTASKPWGENPCMTETLTITRPDDWHLHLRDGVAMAAVLPATAAQFARAIVMPNLKPPVTTAAAAAAYRERIAASLPKGMAENLKASLVSQQPLLAPVLKGQRIATLKLSLDDRPYGEYPVVALETVPVAGMIGRAWDAMRLWFE